MLELVPELRLLQEMWAEQGLPGEGGLPCKHPRKRMESCFPAAPKTMVCHSVCPAHPPAPQTPGATATINQAAGRWAAGPGQ